MIRVFLALPLAEFFLPEISSFLERIQTKIKGVKWVKPQEVHATLHFFGDVPDTEIPKIRSIVHPIASQFSPLTLALDGTGFFPSPLSPRIIWAGMTGDGIQLLIQLQGQIEEGLGGSGFPVEERDFKPHATIARTKNKMSFSEKEIAGMQFPKTAVRLIDRIVLFQSHWTSQGARYEILEKFDFS